MNGSPVESKSLSTLSDAELACRLQNGCEQGFEELDHRFRRRLQHVLNKRLPRREDAEDVVQQTLFRVFRKIHLFDTRQRLSPWVFTIAMRLAVEHGRRKQLPSCSTTAAGVELTDNSLPPDQQLHALEERNRLWSLAGKVLKPEQWTALWLHYGEELSLAEVARTLGKSKPATSVLLFRARKALLPYLEETSYQESFSKGTPDRKASLVEANS